MKVINKTYSDSYQPYNTILSSFHLKNQLSYPFFKILPSLLKSILFLNSKLNSYQFYTNFQSCDNSTQIGTKTHENITAYLPYPFKSQLTKFMDTLKHIKYFLYYCSAFVGLLKGFLAQNCFHYILNIFVLLKVKSWTIFTFAVTALSKKTSLTFLFKKSATKLDSASFVLPSPVAEFYPRRTQKFTFWCNFYNSSINRVLSSSWILSNIWHYIVVKKIFNVLYTIITSICYYCFYGFSFSISLRAESVSSPRKCPSHLFASVTFTETATGRDVVVT